MEFYFGENLDCIKLGIGYLKVDVEIKEDFNRVLIIQTYLMLIKLGLSIVD